MIGSIPEIFAKRAMKYLLKRYFGKYLETFRHEEASLNFNKGTAIVDNVSFKVEALNALCKEYNLPVEFISGTIDIVVVEIPVSSLFVENSVIEFRNVHFVIQAKKGFEDMSMLSSMWESMTSSYELAEDCLLQKLDNDSDLEPSQPTASVEIMTNAFKSVLSKLKLHFTNVTVRLECAVEDSNTGVALEIRVKSAEVYDQEGVDAMYSKDESSDSPSSYCVKTCLLKGIDIYTSQFSVETESNLDIYASSLPTQLPAGSPEMPPPHHVVSFKKLDNSNLQIEPILIARINGLQQIQLSLKQSESVIGPKVDIRVNLGQFNLFLTPYQIEMLINLAQALAKPGKLGKCMPVDAKTSSNRPMQAEDIAFVKEEWREHHRRMGIPSRSLRNTHGWSSHSLEESTEDFHLLTMEQKRTPEILNMPDDLDSSYSSSLGSEKNFFVGSPSSAEGVRVRRPSRGRGSNYQNFIYEATVELTQIYISCSSLFIVALHEDMASDSANSEQMLIKSKTEKNFAFFRSRAEKFFNDLSILSTEGLNFKDFHSIRGKLSSLCQTNHLRLLATGVKLEGSEKVLSLQQLFNASLTILDLEVLECLYNSSCNENFSSAPMYMELVSFDVKTPNTNSANRTDPCLRIKYDRCASDVRRATDQPANKLVIHLAPVAFELDISLLDRIQYLLRSAPVDSGNKQAAGFFHKQRPGIPESFLTMESTSSSSTRTEVQMFSKFIVLNLRFPIPDLRPVHDMERMPWWKQNLRKEIFIMELCDTSLSFNVDDEVEKKYLIKCRDFHGLLKMSPNEEPISFIRVSVDPEVEKAMRDGGFGWPLLEIKSMPAATSNPLFNEQTSEQEEPQIMTFADILYANIKTGPSPFCSNSMFCGKKYRQSDDTDNEEMTYADEEIIRPADKAKLNDFIDHTMNNSQYVFNFTLPTVNIVLPDKNFFRVLKNRLFNDLAMWQEAPVHSYPIMESSFMLVPSVNLNPLLDNKGYASSYQNDEPISGSDDEDKSTNYFSVNEHITMQRQKFPRKKEVPSLTKFSFLISIVKGSMLFHVPTEDDEIEESAEEQYCGKLQLILDDSRLFVASNYAGNLNEAYTCFQMNKGSLSHASHTLMPLQTSVVPPYVRTPSPDSNQIVYASEPGVLSIAPSFRPDRSDLLAISVHSVNDLKQQIKTFKLAIGFSGATLRHYMCPKKQLFINQFIQFMNHDDEPIKGFTPSAIVVELHLHLLHCAVDYRPLYLPLKTMLTVQEFSLSTNITSANSSLMRIVSEDLRLFLSTDMILHKVDLKDDYVCIIDTGLIDVSVRVTEIEGMVDPKFELSMSNDVIRVRTCVDSFQALHRLLVYLAENSDLNKPVLRSRTTSTHSTTDTPDEDIGNLEDVIRPNVHELMAEATREYEGPQNFIPEDSDTDDTDDGFCIIEDGVGIGLLPENREPQIKTYAEDQMNMMDNYYGIPAGRLNLLKAPKNFPKPVLSHTLREMSILWRIYGGHDFPLAKTPVKKRVTIQDPLGSLDDLANIKISSDRASFCKVTPLTKEFNVNAIHYSMENFTDRTREEDGANGWIARGGPSRDHKILMDLHMNKVQYQHEEYPEDSEYASRDILIINDFEIKDKMADSRINKFLHQYSTESMPRQTHANMLVIKAVHVRPDQRPDNQECMLTVSCKPLKLNMKQDSLMFLYNFFKEFSQSASDTPCSSPVSEVQSPVGSPGNAAFASHAMHTPTSPTIPRYPEPQNLIFFRSFKFYPEVLIKLDYHGQRIDMDQGAFSGLVLGLGQLERSEVRLKRLNYRHGLLGAEKLISYAINEWIKDIKTNQVSSILKGIGPMHPFVQLFQGLRDLIWLPVEQYRKDGQIVRGFRRGASSFSTSTATACLELSTFVVGFLQGAAEIAFDMVSPGPSVANRTQRGSLVGRQVTQPADVREGVASAFAVVKEGLEDTARSIARVAACEHEHKGVQGAVGGVLRQIPPAAIKPFIVTAEAACILMDGVKHQLNPDSHREAMEKWRTKKS